MRGGHFRVGPVAFDASTRALRGSKTRARHRTKGDVGVLAMCEPPPHLDADERAAWTYYAPLLHAAGRLTLESRDVLAKYCAVLASVVRLKRVMAAPDYIDVLVTEGRTKNQPRARAVAALAASRRTHVQTDLLLSPAAAVRAPKPAAAHGPEDVELDAILA